jgi:hypothetical protein
VRFEPTGFGGGGAFEDAVKLDDGPEEQATKANIKAAIRTDERPHVGFGSLPVREVIWICGRIDQSSMAYHRKAIEFNGPNYLRYPSGSIRLE